MAEHVDDATNASRSDRGPNGRFLPGNPGRPRGARHRTTVAIEELLEGEAAALTRKVIELALAGDPMCLRMCMDRLAPISRSRTLEIDLPALATPQDSLQALIGVVRALAEGSLDLEQAQALSALIESTRKMIETITLEERIARLEERATKP